LRFSFSFFFLICFSFSFLFLICVVVPSSSPPDSSGDEDDEPGFQRELLCQHIRVAAKNMFDGREPTEPYWPAVQVRTVFMRHPADVLAERTQMRDPDALFLFSQSADTCMQLFPLTLLLKALLNLFSCAAVQCRWMLTFDGAIVGTMHNSLLAAVNELDFAYRPALAEHRTFLANHHDALAREQETPLFFGFWADLQLV
jgi:hypothetical protein